MQAITGHLHMNTINIQLLRQKSRHVDKPAVSTELELIY